MKNGQAGPRRSRDHCFALSLIASARSWPALTSGVQARSYDSQEVIRTNNLTEPSGLNYMQPNSLEGVVQAHPRGFGFVQTEQAERFFMKPALLRRLLPGDTVGFTTEPGKEPDTWQVARIWLLRREVGSWLGVLTQTPTGWTLEPDEPCFVPLRVPAPTVYTTEDVVRITTPALTGPISFGALPTYCDGTVAQELGARQVDGFEQTYALARHRFEPEFSPEILAECEQLAQAQPPAYDPASGREDLQALPFVTVDSATTQDFDDAIFAEATPSGWRVLVAIADVSHYVKAGSSLDLCAQSRGTSVYLPGKTVPMLPRVLSQGLCALRAQVPRYAVVVGMSLNASAELLSTRVFRAVISVAENLTYDYVLDVLSPAPASTRAPSAPVLACLQHLNTIYQEVSKHAEPGLSGGAAEAPEPIWLKDATTDNIAWVVRHDAHKLVECFMLMANRQVAQHLGSLGAVNLFRHQTAPTEQRWQDLTAWAGEQGQALPDKPSRSALSDFLTAMSPEQQFPAQLQIRAVMSSATYDRDNASHFSLGYDTYTHFTSPIRRYADLVVHRLLMGEACTAGALQAFAKACSGRSRAAKLAERYVWDKLKKRGLINAGPAQTARLVAYLVGQSRFGARAVVLPWQCVCDISAQELIAQGYTFNSDTRVWSKAGHILNLGSYLVLKEFSLEEYRAKSEVRACLAQVIPDHASPAAQALLTEFSL